MKRSDFELQPDQPQVKMRTATRNIASKHATPGRVNALHKDIPFFRSATGGAGAFFSPMVQKKPAAPAPAKALDPEQPCPVFNNPNSKEAIMTSLCIPDVPKSMPPTCTLTQWHNEKISTAKVRAIERVKGTYKLVSIDSSKGYIEKEAVRFFDGNPPKFDEIKKIITEIYQGLNGKAQLFGASCAEPECRKAGVVAFTNRGGHKPIGLCPASFRLDGLYQTLIHEVAHWAGVEDTFEGYCSEKNSNNCNVGCGDKNMADAWMHFIDCIGKPIIREDFNDKILQSVEDIE